MKIYNKPKKSNSVFLVPEEDKNKVGKLKDCQVKIKPHLENIALAVIKKEQRDKTKKLDLRYCGLTELPPLLFELDWLEELILGEYFDHKYSLVSCSKNQGKKNELKHLPAEIAKLKQLKKFALGSQLLVVNKIDAAPLADLELEELYLTGCIIPENLKVNKLKVLSLFMCAWPDDLSFVGFSALKKFSVFNMRILQLETIYQLEKLNCLSLQEVGMTEFPQNLAKAIAKKTDFYLDVSENPFLKTTDGLIKEDYKGFQLNNFHAFLHDYQRLFVSKETTKTVSLPAKFILLGNSKVGKTCLTNFLIRRELCTGATESTEILKISNWEVDPFTKQKVFIYDFGGQDFYHATYQMFLTKESLYAVLWDKATNRNRFHKEPSKGADPYYDFSVQYWLGNIRYLHDLQRMEEEKLPSRDDIFIIENKIDLSGNEENLPPTPQEMLDYCVLDTLKICLIPQAKNEEIYALRRQLMRQTIFQKMKELLKERVLFANQAQLVQNVIWYKTRKQEKPLHFIYEEFKNKFAPNDSCDDREVRSVLRLLAKRGLILYYDGHQKVDQLQGTVIWLNPERVLEKIHDILVKKFKPKSLSEKGKLTQVEMNTINKQNPHLFDLMQRQQIVFCDNYLGGKQKYIVPQLLAEREDDSLFKISQIGLKHGFSIKFKDFMPYGIFGRLMCDFGKLPDQKYYAKSQMIFTRSKAKIWASVDQINLCLHFKVGSVAPMDLKELYAYLFEAVLKAYYRKGGEPIKTMLPRAEKPYPKNMQLSLDGEYFANYSALQKELAINVIATNKVGKRKEIPAYRFNYFLENEKGVPKNVFISYAPSFPLPDLLIHLSPMVQKGIIKVHHDSQVHAGEEWLTKVVKKMKKADIIVLMVSADFLSSTYIQNLQLKEAMQQLEKGETKIIPFIVSNCDWQSWEAFPAWVMDQVETQIAKEIGDRDFSMLQALPLKAGSRMPFPLNQWAFKENAYMQLVGALQGKPIDF